ncbi:long-chain fatty acid--CoA ligase [Rhodococcus sp. NPDC059968]|uniref:acyl-CoA synthetase n=1 Tax=Rhodococcus sp. NPDC059968 TaxID=3347017 RepID=UPI00367000DB
MSVHPVAHLWICTRDCQFGEVIMHTDVGLGSWPWRRARITPDRIALVEEGRVMTYRHLADRVARLAASLADAGVRPGDRVAYLGPNAIATFEALFATTLAGAVFVPLNTRLSPAEVEYTLADSAARVLFTTGAHHETISGIGVPPESLVSVVSHDAGSCPWPALDYEQFLESGSLSANFAPVGLDDACLILYTSGTTGRPKGAMLNHGNVTFNTLNQFAHIDVLESDRALCIAPMFHVTGLNQVTLPTLFKGGSVEVISKFDAATVLKAIESQEITSFSAVPTILQLICEHPAWSDTDLSSLRYVVYGGSPVIERVARAWLDRGVRLQQGYGMTEATAGVYLAPGDGASGRPTSVGFPHFYTDVAVQQHGAVRAIEAGDRAELLVRGPNVFGASWKRPNETAESLVDGWFRTGDVVEVAEDGWASIVDRVKDVIISGGENIYPAEVEAVLAQHPNIAAAAVIGIADSRWGEVGIAFVSPVEGTTIETDDVTTFLAGRLARYKIPRHFEVLTEIPRNATGKIQRAALREKATAATGNEHSQPKTAAVQR